MVDHAVERRRAMANVLVDPSIVQFIPERKSFRRVMGRMNRLLMGAEAGPDTITHTAMIVAAISGAAVHPLLVGLDDDTLRAQLLSLAKHVSTHGPA